MKTPQQIRNEVEKGCGEIFVDENGNDAPCKLLYCNRTIPEPHLCPSCLAKLSILTEYDKSIKEMIEDWKRNSILKYDDDCPYCQRHISNTIIQAKELLSKIGDVQQTSEEKQDE